VPSSLAFCQLHRSAVRYMWPKISPLNGGAADRRYPLENQRNHLPGRRVQPAPRRRVRSLRQNTTRDRSSSSKRGFSGYGQAITSGARRTNSAQPPFDHLLAEVSGLTGSGLSRPATQAAHFVRSDQWRREQRLSARTRTVETSAPSWAIFRRRRRCRE